MNGHTNYLKLTVMVLIMVTFLPASVISTSSNASISKSRLFTENGETLNSRKIDEIRIKKALEHKLVKERLSDSGLSDENVIRKMEKMTDEEVHQLASLSEKLPAGGNFAGFLVGVLAITVLVLAILYLAKRV